jgi:pyridoxal 5'-phosphate synthase pdxT subunit
MEKPRVGVLALQGDFEAHLHALERVGASGVLVREAAQIAKLDALILPGGESTTIGKLMVRFGIDAAVSDAHSQGLPIWGTCAGMILLAKRIASGGERGGQPTLGLMDITVARNAFGRQVDSFESEIESDLGLLRGVFIRAPYVVESGEGVSVLARFKEKIVLVRERNLLASAFHPELTDDDKVLRYYLDEVVASS